MRNWMVTIFAVILISMLITSCSEQRTVMEQVQEHVAESLSVPEQIDVLFGDGNQIKIQDSFMIEKIIKHLRTMSFIKVEGPDTVGQNFTLMFSMDKQYSSTGYFVINNVYYKAKDTYLVSEINKSVLDYGRSITQNNPVAGDKLYVPEGYKAQLLSMNLTEVAPMPYFTQPFICVAKNADGQQFALVFRSSDKVDSVKLPISYEDTIKRVESMGFKMDEATKWNLHLFEINHHLFWNFEDGTGKVWLSLAGEVVEDPFTINKQ